MSKTSSILIPENRYFGIDEAFAELVSQECG